MTDSMFRPCLLMLLPALFAGLALPAMAQQPATPAEPISSQPRLEAASPVALPQQQRSATTPTLPAASEQRDDSAVTPDPASGPAIASPPLPKATPESAPPPAQAPANVAAPQTAIPAVPIKPEAKPTQPAAPTLSDLGRSLRDYFTEEELTLLFQYMKESVIASFKDEEVNLPPDLAFKLEILLVRMKKESGHYMDNLIQQLEQDLKKNLADRLKKRMEPPPIKEQPYNPWLKFPWQ